MNKQIRSDDFIDGLQVAYKEVYKLADGSQGSMRKAFDLALSVIDQQIDSAAKNEETKLIIL